MSGPGNRWRRRRALVFGLALGCIGLVVVVLGIRLHQPGELEHWMAEQHQRGERFSVQEVVAPVDLEMSKAARQLTEATERLRSMAVDPSTLRLMRPLLPGHARVLWKEEAIPGSGRWPDAGWEELASQMRSNAPVLREIRALLKSPRSGPANDLTATKIARASFIAVEHRCAHWLTGAELDALRRGALDEAVDQIHAIIGLARMNANDCSVANLLNRVALAGIGVAATWEALQAPGWDEARLVSMQQAWEGLAFSPELERAVVQERASGVSLFEYARTHRDRLGEFSWTMGVGSANPFAQALDRGIALPVWQTAWVKGDELNFLRQSGAALDVMRVGRKRQSYAGLPAELKAAMGDGESGRSWAGQFRFRLSEALLPRWDRVSAMVLRQEVLQQMTTVAIALERYQVRKGCAPKSLSELVPEFLAVAPHDAFTGGELRYQGWSEGGWVLSSAGENRVDEGGGGDDIAWPAAGLVDDITGRPSTGVRESIVVLEGVPLIDAIRNLARHARIDLQFDPRVTERWHPEVSLRRDDVSAEEVLKRLLRERGLAMLRSSTSEVVRITLVD